MFDKDSQLLEEALAKVYIKESLDPHRENRFATYDAWKQAMKAAGAVRLDGNRDIATALNAEGRGVGEWDGSVGILYKNTDKNVCKSCGGPLADKLIHPIFDEDGNPLCDTCAAGDTDPNAPKTDWEDKMTYNRENPGHYE